MLLKTLDLVQSQVLIDFIHLISNSVVYHINSLDQFTFIWNGYNLLTNFYSSFNTALYDVNALHTSKHPLQIKVNWNSEYI